MKQTEFDLLNINCRKAQTQYKMKIDFDHWKGAQIGDDLLAKIELEKNLSIINALNPKFSKDGNQWCFLYGELPNDCIVGFGDTPNEAMKDFVKNFYIQKDTPINTKQL